MGDEVTRRLLHATGTAVPLAHILAPDRVTWRVVQALLVVALLVALALEVVRLYVGLDWAIYDRLTRAYEQDNPAGYFLYAVGMTAVALAFTPTIALPAMLLLTIADPVSGLLSDGQLRPTKQSWVLLATFGVALLLAAPFVPPRAAILGALAATVADGVKPTIRGYVVDDNLSIPVAAAVAMSVAVEWLPPLV